MAPNGNASPAVVRIGFTLPRPGAGFPDVSTTREAVEMAIHDTPGIPGVSIQPVFVDDAAGDGSESPASAAAGMRSLVADEEVLAVVGPQTSGAATAQIPLSNAAGLLQCSGSAAAGALTQGLSA